MSRQPNVIVFKRSYLCTLWWGVTCWCNGRGQGQKLVAASKGAGSCSLEKGNRSTAHFLETFTKWQAKATFVKNPHIVLSVRDKMYCKWKVYFILKVFSCVQSCFWKKEWETKEKRKESVIKKHLNSIWLVIQAGSLLFESWACSSSYLVYKASFHLT